MVAITMNTYQAVKVLKEAGFTETQSVSIVDVFTDFQNDNLVTKADLAAATASIKGEISTLKSEVSTIKSEVVTIKNEIGTLKSENGTIKNDLDWIKKLLMAISVTAIVAAVKYIFLG